MAAVERTLKADKWWGYKVPPILGVAYYMLSRAEPTLPLATALGHLALFLVATVSIAGFAYLLTDFFDLEEDRKTKSRNIAAPMGKRRTSLLLLLLAVMGWLPWLYLPLGWPGILLIGLEFALFALYAVPPVRLKRRGLPGVVADALYAHAIPVVVTWLTFAHLGGVPATGSFGLLLGLWGLTVGLRHILQHQVDELSRDQHAGVATFAVRNGWQKTMQYMSWIRWIEFPTFSLLQLIIGSYLPVVIVGFVSYLGLQVFVRKNTWVTGRLHLSRIAGTLRYSYLSRFYESWWPLLISIALSFEALPYLVLPVIHCFLFRRTLITPIRHVLHHLAQTLASSRRTT